MRDCDSIKVMTQNLQLNKCVVLIIRDINKKIGCSYLCSAHTRMCLACYKRKQKFFFCWIHLLQ